MKYFCPIKNIKMKFKNHKVLDEYFEFILNKNGVNYKIEEIKVSEKSCNNFLDRIDFEYLLKYKIVSKKKEFLLTDFPFKFDLINNEKKINEIKFFVNFPINYLLLKFYDISYWFYLLYIKSILSDYFLNHNFSNFENLYLNKFKNYFLFLNDEGILFYFFH
jgi:hypothetical protein